MSAFPQTRHPRAALLFLLIPLQALAAGSVCLTELMYHPVDGAPEFIEIANLGEEAVDISGATFTEGVAFTFPAGFTLDPGEHVVITNNAGQFFNRYPGVLVIGQYTAMLSNSGEAVALTSAQDEILFRVNFGDELPWPLAPDGAGFSLTIADPNGDPDEAASWRASSIPGGTPAAADTGVSAHFDTVINEALTHTDPPLEDTIEILNDGDTTVDLRGWFLTDDTAVPAKARIPDDSAFVLDPGEFVTLGETEFGFNPGMLDGEVLPGFFLSSQGNEGVYLFSSDASGALTGWAHGFFFRGSDNGVSFGRHINSVGDELFVAQRALSLGLPNAGPLVGPLVISEISYSPEPGGIEYLEITNVSDADVPLFDATPNGDPANTYELNGAGFAFPEGVVLATRASLVVANAAPATFESTHSVPPGVQVFGPFGNSTPDGTATLDNGGETITLLKPDTPDDLVVPLIVVDEIDYDDDPPWPDARENGNVLLRDDLRVFGDDPENWSAGAPSIGNDLPDPAVIDVDRAFINFGEVRVNTQADETLTVGNLGDETLEGSVDTQAPFLVEPAGGYQIDPAMESSFLVSFAPTEAGEAATTIEFTGGGGAVIPVTGEGFALPAALQVTPATGDFGTVRIGEAAVRTFTVENLGDESLTGAVSTDFPFSIVGEAQYTLEGLASREISVAFTPDAEDDFPGELVFTGGGGAAVSLSGTGTPAPLTLSASPSIVEYGDVMIGTAQTMSVTVSNIGEDPISGTASTNAPYRVSGNPDYDLSPGEDATIDVEFFPVEEGSFSTTLELSGGTGASVQLIGAGVPLPARIAVNPSTIDFSVVFVSFVETFPVTIQNLGGETLIGEATVDAPFSIVPPATYSLMPSASITLEVSFSPTLEGVYESEMTLTGGGEATIAVRGEGALLPARIELSDDRLDFGPVPLGFEATDTINILNNGQDTLEATLDLAVPFSATNGGALSVPGGSSRSLAITFSPVATGVFSMDATILGGGDAPIELRGEGLPALCDAIEDVLDQWDDFDADFGLVPDINADGLPDLAALRLLLDRACAADSSLTAAISQAWSDNAQTLATEDDYDAIVPYRLALAAMLMIDTGMQEEIEGFLARSQIALDSAYAVVVCDNVNTCVSTSNPFTAGVFSATADLDKDGVSNQREYRNAVEGGGGVAEFLAAAIDPARDGSPVDPGPMGCAAGAGVGVPDRVLFPCLAVLFLLVGGRSRRYRQ